MRSLNIENGLPFTEITLQHNANSITISKALIDTGSMSTIISAEFALELNLQPEQNDKIHPIRGIGGMEYVYEKSIESIIIDNTKVSNFILQIGAMDYGFDINAIIGYDLLNKASIIIDSGSHLIYLSSEK